VTEPTAAAQSSDPSLFRFCLSLPIRYDDIDALRHLNNVSYLLYMQQARVDYLVTLGLWDGVDFGEIGVILRETTCYFHAPGYLGETVRVWARVSHLGSKSFHLEYRLETERGEIATGRSVQVCYDYAQARSIPIPDTWRAAILAYEPALPAREGS
jgi:acyl-CoA thioester hydrolase